MAQRRIFSTLALLGIGYAASVACGMRYRGDTFFAVNHWAVQFWCALAGSGFFAFAAFKLNRRTALNILALLVSGLFLELALQALGWAGYLPGPFSTKPRCPYGRVYYAWEGMGNSIRNRYGWYSHDFDLNAHHKTALVGDSFVEALEVHRDRTVGALLQRLLRQAGRDDAVLALGSFGTAPAQYLATIEYAWNHFHPDEVVVFFFVGNDVTDSSPRLNNVPPGHFFYYAPDPVNGVTLSKQDMQTRERFLRDLDFSHHSAAVTLPTTLSSHCMLLQTALTIKDALHGMRRRAPAQTEDGPESIASQIKSLGLNPTVFETPTDPDVEAAMNTLLLTLQACKTYCDERRITLRIVTLPFFPPAFYDQQQGTN